LPYAIVVLGTAGSGKTTLTAALYDYLLDNELDASTINLDPAVEVLPYKPTVDIRDYVDARELMEKMGLGPNGALIASMDMIALNLEELKEEVDSLRSNYLIIDTPGQLELFAFRETGPLVIKGLTEGLKSVALFLIDAVQIVKPSNYLSALLLSASTQVRLKLTQLNVLTKIDIIPKEVLEEILNYIEEPENLVSKLAEDESARLMWSEDDILYLVEKLSIFNVIPVSAVKGEGLDDLYAYIQRVVAGGEDYLTEEPSPRL